MKGSVFLLITALTALPALAAPPDAGQTTQELKRPPVLLRPGTPLVIDTQVSETVAPGGATVTLEKVSISGNTIFAEEELLRLLGDYKGKEYDLAGLKSLADIITQFYKDSGYPFARAIIPAQNMGNGLLEIRVIEGKYGSVDIRPQEGINEREADSAGEFLSSLDSGEVIQGSELERATLILDDQPGYNIFPVVRPGEQFGSGDLLVDLQADKKFGGRVGLDNYGNRYTGRKRAGVDLYANSPFMFGDQATLSTIYTEEDMWFGSLGYNAPLGTSGLRGQVGYSHTYYELGEEFAVLDASGVAQIASASLSFPIIRSQKTNMLVSFGYQRKWLEDKQRLAGLDYSKDSHVLPLTLSFDRRDQFAGGGVTYGTASWTHGSLHLDEALRAIDGMTAETAGGFDKLNLDVARIQSLPENFLFFGRFAGQVSADNLDSSERFGLGGPSGVRAYPVGEGFGDEGWLAQLELRYSYDPVSPYVFYDSGRVRINHNPWAGGDNHRSISGAGLGLRAEYEGFSGEASVAWATNGGDPQSDSKDSTPIFWLRTGFNF